MLRDSLEFLVMRSISVITVVAFLSLFLHESLEHGGSAPNGLAAVQENHHGDEEAGGERSDHEHPSHEPSHHDSDSHQHVTALLQLTTKPLVQYVPYVFAEAPPLAHSTRQDTDRRTEFSAPPPPRISLYLSTQTLLL